MRWGSGGPDRKDSANRKNPRLRNETIIPIAVNLANPTESDFGPVPSWQVRRKSPAVWGGHSMWFYLTLGATVGICLEWILHQRRIVA